MRDFEESGLEGKKYSEEELNKIQTTKQPEDSIPAPEEKEPKIEEEILMEGTIEPEENIENL